MTENIPDVSDSDEEEDEKDKESEGKELPSLDVRKASTEDNNENTPNQSLPLQSISSDPSDTAPASS